MSQWTNITGMVKVCPNGATTEEMRKGLESSLALLPKISGSEEDAHFKIVQSDASQIIANHIFYIVVDSCLRDRDFTQTYHETIKWLSYLEKQHEILDVLLRIKGQDKYTVISNTASGTIDMFEMKT